MACGPMSGPISTPGSKPLPTFNELAAAAKYVRGWKGLPVSVSEKATVLEAPSVMSASP